MKLKELLEVKKDPDRVAGGYKAMATRLRKDLGKEISPSEVKSYLQKIEKKKKIKDLKNKAEGISKPSYKWSTIYKILKGHFKK